MFSTFIFPRCFLRNSCTLNCMTFPTLPHPLCSLAKHWKSRREGASKLVVLTTQTHESFLMKAGPPSNYSSHTHTPPCLWRSIGIRQGPGNWSLLLLMSLNHERRTGRVRHSTAHLGVVPPGETERNPDDHVLQSQGQAGQSRLTPLPPSPPLPQERQTRVGREQGGDPAPAAFQPPSPGLGRPHYPEPALRGGHSGPGAAGADCGAAGRRSEQRVSGEAGSLPPPFCEAGWRRGCKTGLRAAASRGGGGAEPREGCGSSWGLSVAHPKVWAPCSQ